MAGHDHRIRLVVLFGGQSAEHEVSCTSALNVLLAADRDRYDVQPVGITREGRWVAAGDALAALAAGSMMRALPAPDTAPLSAELEPHPTVRGDRVVVLPLLHGPMGEDGTVQGLLELAGVPYVGAGVAASAVCMDKDLAKAVLRARGIPVTRSVTIREGDPIDNPFGYPAFVKPARLGSSVGISKVRSDEELAAAVALARRHDEKVLVEELLEGTEVECGVLGNLGGASPPIASVVGEIVPHADWYDYAAKYDDGGSDIIVPARIPDEIAEQVQRIAVDSFVATECEGMARVDFFVRP